MSRPGPRNFFVLVNEPGGQPVGVSANGLENWLYAVGRDRDRRVDYSAAARAWLWDDRGEVGLLTVRCISAGEFDENDHGGRTWVAVGPNGIEYARVTVGVDGHA